MRVHGNPYGGGNANPGGPGGNRTRIQTNVPRGKTSHQKGGGGKPPKKECCPMVAALVSVKRGKFRLAARYVRLSVRHIAARAF